MVHVKYFSLSTAIIFAAAVSLNAQVLKNGICPESANQSAVFDRQFSNLDQNGEINPFSTHFSSALPQYSPALLSATSVGAGAVGTFQLSRNYILRISLLNIYPSELPSPSSQGALIPIEIGFRIPFVNATIGTLGYTLYGETSAGLLLGMIFPTSGLFLNYSLPNSRFSAGASAYAGIGNTLRVDKYVGLYLNGGAGYFDFFSSSFLPRTNYFAPSVSVGFYFNML